MDYEIGVVRRRRFISASESFYSAPPPSASPSYAGPGDVETGWAFWGGLRGYSAAYSTGSNPCLDLHSDSTGVLVGAVNILSTGALDVATAAPLISGGASKIGKLYDQSGNGRHFTQATLANMPTLSLSVIGALPAMLFSDNSFLKNATAFLDGQAAPFSMTALAQRTGQTTNFNFIFATDDLLAPWLAFSPSANLVEISQNGVAEPTATASDNSFHAVNALFNGASSAIYVDGSNNVVNAGTGAITATQGWLIGCGDDANPTGHGMNGYINEVGVLVGDKSSSFSAINSQQHTYWGF